MKKLQLRKVATNGNQKLEQTQSTTWTLKLIKFVTLKFNVYPSFKYL